MNASSFMDKQIMDLTASGESASLFTPNRPLHNNDDVDNLAKDDIRPSYDFQPLRPIIQSSKSSIGPSRVSSDSKQTLGSPPQQTKNYGSLEANESVKGLSRADMHDRDEFLLSQIDRTMKKYADNLLHALEGVSARMTQLETRTRNLENLVDDINLSVGNNHGSTDGKMRHLENILREVQTGVQVLRDKHEIIEAQLELSKLQVSHTKQQSEKLNTAVSSSVPQTVSAPQQQTVSQNEVPPTPQQGYQQLPPPALPPPFPMPQNVIAPAPQSQAQPLSPELQMPNHIPQNQVPHLSQYPPYGQTQDTPNQHYQPTPTQQQLPHSSSAPSQQYPGSYPPYSQPPQQQSQMTPVAPPQGQPSIYVHQEESPYFPSQSYGPPLHQPLSHPPHAGPRSQQPYGPPQVYDFPPSRSNIGYKSGYNAPTGPNELYPYGGPAQYSSDSKPQHSSSGGSGYSQLPTARILPQAIPTASAVSSGSGSGGSGNNKVPVDDVVDKVASMGFSREQVRATVRRLTDNGQSVDLNTVLDKLMNG